MSIGIGLGFLLRLVIYGALLVMALTVAYLVARVVLYLGRRLSRWLAQRAHEQKVRLLIAWSKSISRRRG